MKVKVISIIVIVVLLTPVILYGFRARRTAPQSPQSGGDVVPRDESARPTLSFDLPTRGIAVTLPVTHVPVRVDQVTPFAQEKMMLGGVQMNNLYTLAKETDPNGNLVFPSPPEYKLLYLTQYQQFLITIIGSPFPKMRREAEEDFLLLIGVGKDEACKLDVVISTPFSANPDFAGESYPLSFCQQG